MNRVALYCLLWMCFAFPAFGQPAVGTDTAHLAPVPPMGWASWNHYFCDYNEQTIRDQADALVSTGMRDAGYKYVIIQECIARDRDASGNLIADSARFPSGMLALTAYIHKLGLKAGIYTDIGRHTCYPNPQYQGSYGHEQQDAATFAAWGMDLVEMDYCHRVKDHTGRWVYERMAEAIKKTGRPMIFYLCSWGNENPWEWAQGKAQMWRTEGDISQVKNHVEWAPTVRNFHANTAHSVLSGPESWNDADMLEIGNPGFNDTEAQAQMSMWAISPSPLLAGADLTHISPQTREIYLNKEVLAINQDPLGAGAEKIAQDGPGVETWIKPLAARTSGEYAVMLLNASNHAAAMTLRMDQLDLLTSAKTWDLWLHKDVSLENGTYRAQVAPHSAVLLRVDGVRSWKHGVIYEAEWPGVDRLGAAMLFPCKRCSRGYAMALSGNNQKGSLRFEKIAIARPGTYRLRVQCVRTEKENKRINVAVNGTRTPVLVAGSRNWMDVPVSLLAGENTIELSYTGARSLYIDYVRLSLP